MIGLAVLLGFLTAYAAAVAAGMIMMVDPVAPTRSFSCSPRGMPMNGPGVLFAASNSINGAGSAVALAAGVIWLSASGVNPWSIDALVFGRRGFNATVSG